MQGVPPVTVVRAARRLSVAGASRTSPYLSTATTAVDPCLPRRALRMVRVKRARARTTGERHYGVIRLSPL